MPLRRLLLIASVCWLFTGLYSVRVDEQAIVRRFGAVIAERVPPGLHVGLPWGIDRVDRLKIHEQKRLNIGFELPDAALGRAVNPGRREFFTGDQNLIHIELLVQYTIRDPRAYLFASSDGTETLRQAAESAVAAAVAARAVDLLLTTGKLEIQGELRQRTQALVDGYGLGVRITAVQMQAVTPPLQVADAFRDVASAKEDRDRIIKEAESYANAALPAAEGEASRRREEALAYRDQKIRQAKGDAARFVQAYNAYRLAPDVTSARLYLETVEEILPRMKLIHLDSQGGRAPIDLHILPRSPAPPGNAGVGNGPEPGPPAPRSP